MTARSVGAARHIKTIERRIEYLKGCVHDEYAGRSYDIRELEALEWALDKIRLWINEDPVAPAKHYIAGKPEDGAGPYKPALKSQDSTLGQVRDPLRSMPDFLIQIDEG
jgi:hypothetical protein